MSTAANPPVEKNLKKVPSASRMTLDRRRAPSGQAGGEGDALTGRSFLSLA